MFWHILKLSSTMYPPFEHSLLSSFSWSRRRKESLPKSLEAFKVFAVRTSGVVNRVFFSRQTGFSGASIRPLIKPLVPTEPAKQRTRLLGLGLKLSPSNMPRMLNKGLMRFMQSLSRVRQNWTNQRRPRWQREKQQQEQSKKKNAIQSYLALIFRATIHHILLSYSILLLFAAKFLLPVFK